LGYKSIYTHQFDLYLHRFGANRRSSFTKRCDLPTFGLVISQESGVAKLENADAYRVAALNPL
jgi:hypothetical protein